MQDRRYERQEVCRTGIMQGRRDAGQKGCRTVGMQDRRNAGQEGCRRAGMQGRRDAGEQGCSRRAGMQPAVMHARKMQLLRLHAMHAHCSNTKMRTGCQVSSEGGTGRQLANDHVTRCPVVSHNRRTEPRQQGGPQQAAGSATIQARCISIQCPAARAYTRGRENTESETRAPFHNPS